MANRVLLEDFLSCAELPADTVRLLSQARKVVTSEEVDRAVDQLAVKITVAMQDKNPVILTVLHGGLVLSGMLSRRLAFPCEFGYLHATRYGDATEGNALEWRGCDHPDLQGRTVLIVDDILDEGKTLAALIAYCTDQRAGHVSTAVLVERTGIERELQAEFAGLALGPGFLIGCGMDVAGYGRNLSAIYNLAS